MHAREWILLQLKTRMTPASFAWLAETAEKIASGAKDRVVFSSFGLALRHAGKEPLRPAAPALAEAGRIVPGWNPQDWTCDQAARIFLLLSIPPGPDCLRLLDQLYQTSDLGESQALLKALALMPSPADHLPMAREGARSNVKMQFESVALRNPYPAAYFDQGSWNQLVAKALFVDSPLKEIFGLDTRCNPDLSRMLVDYVLERRAAGRSFDPQLWRCVGRFADGNGLAALAKSYAEDRMPGKRAAALALLANGQPAAVYILEGNPALASEARTGELTWENFNDR